MFLVNELKYMNLALNVDFKVLKSKLVILYIIYQTDKKQAEYPWLTAACLIGVEDKSDWNLWV